MCPHEVLSERRGRHMHLIRQELANKEHFRDRMSEHQNVFRFARHGYEGAYEDILGLRNFRAFLTISVTSTLSLTCLSSG